MVLFISIGSYFLIRTCLATTMMRNSCERERFTTQLEVTCLHDSDRLQDATVAHTGYVICADPYSYSLCRGVRRLKLRSFFSRTDKFCNKTALVPFDLRWVHKYPLQLPTSALHALCSSSSARFMLLAYLMMQSILRYPLTLNSVKCSRRASHSQRYHVGRL